MSTQPLHSPFAAPDAQAPSALAPLQDLPSPAALVLEHPPRYLGEAQLLAAIAGADRTVPDAAKLASRILDEMGGPRQLGRWSAADLAGIEGVDNALAVRIAAGMELGRRAAYSRRLLERPIRGPGDLVPMLRSELLCEESEVLVAVLLDARHRVMRVCRISQGSATATTAHPREVFSAAVRARASALVLAHNHPSGDPAPSTHDLEVTRRLADAGTLLEIPLLDHIIVAASGHVSLRQEPSIGSNLFNKS